MYNFEEIKKYYFTKAILILKFYFRGLILEMTQYGK